MTEPTDAEIRRLAATGSGVYQDDETAIWEITDPSLLKFARAVLAKWGTPQAETGEPVAMNEALPSPHPTAQADSVPAADWTQPTTVVQRLADAVQLLCGGKRPPDAMVHGWLDHSSEELQSFAASHGPSWAQGIGLIDAAMVMMDQPTEITTIDHQERDHEHRAARAPAESVTAPAGVVVVTDDMVLAALRAQYPAAYGQYLRHPANGPKTSLRTESEIDTARRMIVAALSAAPIPPTHAADSVLEDAELGRVAMRFVDRAGDPHPGIDDAETICREFYAAMSAVLDPRFQRRMDAARKQGGA